MDNRMKLAVVNFHPEWGEKAANLARIVEHIEAAAAQGADLILFPETALTGYNVDGTSIVMQQDNAETIPGPTADALATLSRKLGIYVVLGMPERDAESGTLYNSALVTGPDGIVGSYRKIHPAAKEVLWAKKGDEPFLFETRWGPIGLGICYDTYCFPELVRTCAALGCRLYLNPTAMPAMDDWSDFYHTLLKARVLENGCYIASANLVGEDKDIEFPGDSLILGPTGKALGVHYYAGPVQEEGVVMAEIDLSLADDARVALPLYTENFLTGVPDWRPDICETLLARVRRHERWSHT